jgi:siroheme synthase-like protein
MVATNAIPMPQGGASLMIAFRCAKKSVLVIGYDSIAANRVLSALDADAQVAIVGPLHLMCQELVYRIQHNQIEWLGSEFEEEQLIGNHLVFVTRSDDIELCQTVSNACCARRIPVNVANQKHLSDFDMTCTYRDQSLQVAVSTNGQSAVNLADRILQTKVASSLSPDLGQAVQNVGLLRKQVKQLDPAPSSSLCRYQWLSRICEDLSLQRLAALTTTDIKELLGTYPISFLQDTDLQDKAYSRNRYDVNLEDSVEKSLLSKHCQVQTAPNTMDNINMKFLEG